jgi:cytochrome c oxidase subunit 2
MSFDFSKAMEWAYKDMLTFFPENVSTFGGELDSLFAMIYYASVAIFFLTYAILIAFIIMYRHQEGRKAYYYHGNNLMEFTWTLLPTFLFAGIGLWSDSAWTNSKYAYRVPNPDVTIDVLGYQSGFGWQFRYPGPDGIFGNKDRNQISSANPFGIDSNDANGKDDLVIISPGGTRPVEVHLPINKNILVNLSSNDVLHSFFLPNFRVKQDAVPGQWIKVWFNGTKAGTYEIACAELCGSGHYNMRGVLVMDSQEKYDEWLDQQYKLKKPELTVPVSDTSAIAEAPSESTEAKN